MLGTLRKAEYAELMILFFIQAAGMAVWFVPLGPSLDANAYHVIKPYAFASNALAAFISPLMFGAMADRHVPPAQVLRWLATANRRSRSRPVPLLCVAAHTLVGLRFDLRIVHD